MNLNGRLSFTGNVSGSMGAQLVADVEANPSGAPSQTLVSIRVGDVIYSIPSGGGGGGTSDYNALNNKPKVNNVVLSGDLTLADLGIQPAISFPGDGSKYLDGNGSFSTPAAGGYFIDTSDVLQSAVNIPANTDVTYTATQDCVVVWALIAASNGTYSVNIDGVDIASSWNQTGARSNQDFVFLKSGQTITMSQSYGNNDGTYTVYAIM